MATAICWLWVEFVPIKCQFESRYLRPARAQSLCIISWLCISSSQGTAPQYIIIVLHNEGHKQKLSRTPPHFVTEDASSGNPTNHSHLHNHFD